MSKMVELAKAYNIPVQATPEDLEFRWGKVITFGDKVILVGRNYHKDGNCYFSAIYEFLDDDDQSNDAFISIREISEKRFKDEGHAMEWALKQN